MSFSTLLQSITFLLTVLMFAGCSNNESTFVAAAQDADKGSVVYVYRPSSSTNFMMSPKVVIDGNEKFNIGSGDYAYVYLQSGKHTVGLNPTDQYITDAAVTIIVEAGKSYYLRVNTSLKFEPEKMNTRKFWIDVVAEQEALTEIGSTEYSGPKVQQSSAVQTDAHEDKAGFSVDKTQDPFAGKY
jgi:hypothetical protein